jgi:hypothetical protein
LRIAYQQALPWDLPIPPDELAVCAKRWDDVGIADRAKQLHTFHYAHGYRFYSSFEHSDAFSLDGYLDVMNDTVPHIEQARPTLTST